MNVVGPGITLEDYQSGKATPIDLFEGQIRGWILPFAQHLAYEHEHSGIAVLLLTSAILEPLGAVLPLDKGGKTSKDKFCRGFERAFKEVPGSKSARKVAERVWQALRDGLFHEAFIQAGLVLTTQDIPILEKDGIIYVDCARFFNAVESAFVEVCNEIRSSEKDSPIRSAFDMYWNKKESEQAKKFEATVPVRADYPPTTSTNTLAPMGLKDRFIKEM